MRVFGKGSSKSFFSEEPVIKGRKKGGFRVRPESPPFQQNEAGGFEVREELSADQVLRGAKKRRRK